MLSQSLASTFARLTLDHIGREYPHIAFEIQGTPGQALETPAQRHPIFHGSYDWHSCVHGWWQLLYIRRLFPTINKAAAIEALGDAMLCPDKIAGEIGFLRRPSSAMFERPYGWAWALALHTEAARHSDRQWASALTPLADVFAERFLAYLPKLTYPVRSGLHISTSFALILAYQWASAHHAVLAALIRECASRWHGEDRDCQAWEPSSGDFLSPALTEALLMANVLSPAEFRHWFDRFLPRIAAGEPATLFTPVHVADRSDGMIVHLDGLNLSRAWCWRTIAKYLGPDHPTSAPAMDAADRHLAASLPHIEGDYMGEHWLATFALLALCD
jgi:hypothetical protein